MPVHHDGTPEGRMLEWVRMHYRQTGRGLPDIGQFTPEERRGLAALVRKGKVRKERGRWPGFTVGIVDKDYYTPKEAAS